MRRSMISVALAAGALLGVSAPALAQQAAAGSPAELTCSDLEGLTPAHAAALVYYVAGYVEGERAGDAAPATGSAATPGNAMDTSAPAMPEGTAPAVGGLTLSAQAVLTACDASADALLADLIADQGTDAEAGGQTDATGAAPANGMAAPPAGGTSTPANSMAPANGMVPANDAAPANSAAPAEPAPTNTTAPAPASTPANDTAPTNAMGAPAASGTAPANSAQ